MRLPVSHLMAHPAVAPWVAPWVGGAGEVSRRGAGTAELLAQLPMKGQSAVFHLSADKAFIERVQTTPEVRCNMSICIYTQYIHRR